MKKAAIILTSFILLAISRQSYGQAVSLGENENVVYNTLYDRVKSFNRSKGDHYDQTFTVNHSNGVTSEIIIRVKGGYLYDLALNSDYEIHYVMKDGLLDRISTQYENLSTEQLKAGFNKLYGEKRIGNYYFSNDYTSYKTIFLSNNGLATVEERSSYETHFPTLVKSKLDNLGVLNNVANQKESNGDASPKNYNGTGSGDGGRFLNIQQRNCISRPTVDNPNHLYGKIVVDLLVDKNGTVISAHAGAAGTTVTDSTLLQKCEQAVLNSKFNSSQTAPEKQAGKMYFIFKVN
jgi:hypothetical protein